jgi:hypothetical protein
MFYLRNGSGQIVWSDTSTFQPQYFLPSATASTVTDNFTLTNIPAGNYTLLLKIVDPSNGYRSPLALAIQGRQPDGAYVLRTGIPVTTSGSNLPPTATISDINLTNSVTLPTNSVSLNVSANDPDGSISSYAWTKVSGPAATIVSPSASTTSITGLVEGNYVFQCVVTDNGGLTTIASKGISVLPATPAPVAPTANAGTDSTITLPKNTVTLIGSGTDPDGTVVSYLWSKVSGPTAGIVSPTSQTTQLNNLLAGTYVFRLTVTDNSGSTGTDDVQVFVNPAPSANMPPVSVPGPTQTIKAPATTTVLNGSLSYDTDGSVVSYVWTKISGSGSTLLTPNSASTSVSGLVPGQYIYQLEVTDNQGAKNLAYIVVNVVLPTSKKHSFFKGN